tara:strand:- start:262 stop:2130 length:1869 start_codon:yes stop_codon:yes gene_type:complete
MATTIQYNIKVNDGDAIRSIGGLEAELAQVNEELKQVDVNSQAFSDLSQKSQVLTKDLQKMNSAAEGFTAEKKFMAADGAIKALTGSVASVVGALSLLGVESEKLGNFEQKALGAVAFGMGLKDLSEGYKQISDSTVLATAKAKIFGKVTKAQLIATGIGAFVVALGLIIAYWDDITAAISGSNNELEYQNDLLASQISEGDIQLELLKLELQATQLRGESDAAIVVHIKNQLLLQQAQNEQLIRNLELQVEAEMSQARQVSTWEILKIAAAKSVMGLEGFADQYKKAINPNSEKALELQEKLTEARRKGGQIDVQLATLENQAEQKRVKRVGDRKKDEEERTARRKEELANEQAAQQQYFDILEEIYQGGIATQADQREEELYQLEEYYNELIMLALLYGEEITPLIEAQKIKEAELRDKYAAEDKDVRTRAKDDQLAIATAQKVGELEIANAKFGLLMQLGGLIDQIGGQNKDAAIAAVIVQQAASIGQIVASTGIANAKAAAASPLTFGQPWVTINTISAGLSIAASVASAAKAISQIRSAGKSSSPAGSSGVVSGARAGSGGGGGGAAVSPFETFSPDGISAEDTAAANPPIRAFVIAEDVTSTQEANARLNARREID